MEGLLEGVSVRSVPIEQLLGPLTDHELRFAPPRVDIAGRFRLPLLHPRVAIVGTREPSDDGRALASGVAEALAKNGVTAVSGLARGVDTAVHRSAIAAGGYTIAVLGTPLDRVNPPSNAALQHEILRDHLAISQFPQGSPVYPQNFVIRNRTMALIADASVIAESGDTGGSLNHGWETLRLGRPLLIHDREFSKPDLAWPREMARYGAIRFKEPSDILEFLPSPLTSPEATVRALLPA